jgi:hypothetical protein
LELDVIRTVAKLGSRKLCIEKWPGVAHDVVDLFEFGLLGRDA